MYKTSLFLTAILLFSGSRAGQLADWTQAAFALHPDQDLAAAERRVGESLQRKAEQWLAGDPSADIKYQTDVIGSDIGYREWEGGVELPLWWPGQKEGYRRESNSSIGLADAMLRAIRLEKAGGVRERLWAVVLAEAERDQAALTLAASEKLLDGVIRRVDAGELPRTDKLLAEKQVLAGQDQLRRLENLLLQRQADFQAYTGVSGPVTAQPENMPAVAEIRDDHPLLLVSSRRLDKARAHRDRILGERRSGPDLWLGGKTTRAASGSGYEDAIGIQLRIPFGTLAHAAPANAEAEQALTEAQTRDGNLRRKLQSRLQQALLDVQGRAAAAERAKRRAALANESLKLNQRAFELGETDLIYLLQAQADANQARQQLLLSRLQHQRAIAMLNQALGVIPQ